MSAMQAQEEKEMIKLNEQDLSNHLDTIISKLAEGDSELLFCNSDFSQDLIDLMNQKYTTLPLKAKLLQEGANGYIIKIVYPDSKGGGCCGCCS